MKSFKVDFQINERGTFTVRANSREEAEEQVRERIEVGDYDDYVLRSDCFVEAW